MSYPQFGYAYSPTAAASSSLATSQLLGVGPPGSGLGSAAGGGGQTGGVSQTSSLPGGGGAATACCGGDSRTPGGGMGGPPGAAPGSDPSSPVGGGSQGTGSGVYSSSLLSYPRVAGLADSAAAVGSVYGSAYAAQGYVPFGGDPSAFYSPLGAADQQADAAWRNLSQPAAWPYDPTGMAGYPYGTSYGGLDVRRKNATRESTSTLKAWLYEHIKNPYPTKGEKIMLAIITKMTLTQVSTWFANARRRLKKENKMQWSPRNRTGDEDDDDKDGCSDGEDGGGEKEGKAGDKHRDEDEDINIVDSGNDHGDQSLLSPSDGLAKIHPGSTSPSATSDPGSNTKPGGPVPAAHARDLFSDVLHHKPGGDLGGGSDPYSRHPLHGLHKASSACSLGGGGEDANGNKLDSPGSHHHHDKPRIWSLADVATSNTGSLVAPHGLTSSASSGARGSPPGGGCALGGLSKTTAFSPPPPHHSSGGGGGFHPWSTTTNNSYGSGGGAGNNTPSGLSSSSPLGGSGGYNTSPFSSPHGTPVATPMGGLTTPGSGAQRHMAAGVTGANTPTQAGYTAAASSMHKFQNGLLGDSVKGSVTHSGYTDDGPAAFKPVHKRL